MTVFSRYLKEENKERFKLWGVFVSVTLTVIAATLFLTKPAANPLSATPLSGLMNLKEMAAAAVPYEQAIANQNPTLIEFYADWCTTCQGMSATIESLHRQYGEHVNFVMLDIDSPQWSEQITQFSATGVPQFTLLDENNASVETWVGKVPEPILSQAFEQIL